MNLLFLVFDIIIFGCGTFAHQMEEDNCSPKREATVDHRDNRPRRQLTTATIGLDDIWPERHLTTATIDLDDM